MTTELTDGTILESEVPTDIQRFPQLGHELPGLYREYLVEFGHLLARRGRAISAEAAEQSYWQVTGGIAARCRVRLIVEDDDEKRRQEADEHSQSRLPTAEEDAAWNPIDGGPALTGAVGV